MRENEVNCRYEDEKNVTRIPELLAMIVLFAV